MKAIAFNGSPREHGNTHAALEIVLQELVKEGIDVELVQMGIEDISGCKACGACGKNKDEKCVIKDDKVNTWIQMIKRADAVIIGSPTYFGGMSSQTKAFVDRVGYVSRSNGNLLRRKVGAAVGVSRRAGNLNTFDEINRFFLISEMIVPGSTYWNVISALKPGETANDAEGVATMQNLGKNIAWLLKSLRA
ncbi:MAG: flavodoxin family protein [Methanomassiliicoccales archaeon]|nr:flavodoxin family protein [Methanomassiliicoccales archaeon]